MMFTIYDSKRKNNKIERKQTKNEYNIPYKY